MNDNVKQLADNLINRAKNMQEFTVHREFDDILFNGVIPFSIKHTMGEEAEITVSAMSQQEAEHQVDQWLRGQRA